MHGALHDMHPRIGRVNGLTRETVMVWSRRAALVLFWPAVTVVIWGELSPSAGDPFDLWDKLLHFTAYFGLAGIATVALGGGRRALWAAFGLIFLGGALEIIQGMVGRDMSLYDEIANSLGVGCGALIGRLYLGRIRLLVEALPPD
jgi:VanZ family protein